MAYDETGREIARQERHSFGNTDHYVLKANKSALHADGEDMIFVEISAEDRDGYPVENASDYVRVTVEGAGRLVGLDLSLIHISEPMPTREPYVSCSRGNYWL